MTRPLFARLLPADMRSSRFALVALLPFALASAADAQWFPLHPGGGGQIQGIELDPSLPDRLYSLSDVDGVYRSDDGGQSFIAMNEALHTEAVSTIQVDPSDSDRLFLGTARGALRSTDGGLSWLPMGGSETVIGGSDGERTGIHVSTLTIDPVEPERVYFAHSWGWKHTYNFYWNALGFRDSDTFHPGEVYVTSDGGETWDIVTFEPESQYMDVYSIEVNPAANNEVYLAAQPGIYKSTDYGQTWEKMSTPEGAFFARGAAVTPDGAYLVATFTTEALPAYPGDPTPIPDDGNNSGNPNATVYTAAIASGADASWLRRDLALPQLEQSQGGPPATEYWRPSIDPRSTAETGYDVLVGTMLGRQGLYSATFFPDAASSNLTDAFWNRVLWREGSEGFQYDQGWDTPTILCRFYEFTPLSWGERRIWATGGQSLLEGDPGAAGWPESAASWSPRYTEFVGTDGPYDMYATRGIQSTVNYDQAALGSYVVQAQADNGLIESFDGGMSWTKQHQPRPGGSRLFSNARAVHIFDTVSPAVTLAAAGVGFGSGSGWTPLHAIVSDAPSSSTDWSISVDATLNGPKNDYVSSIVPALPEPGSTSQGVYVSYQGALGATGSVQYHPDVTELAQGRGAFTEIAGADGTLNNTYKLMAHPTDPAVLYRLTGSALYRMDRDAQGAWSDTELATGVKDYTVWPYNGFAYVAYGNNDRVNLSEDGGTTFQTVWTIPESAYGPWADWVFIQTAPDIGGMIGMGQELFFGTSQYKNRKPLGFYRASILNSGDGPSLVVQEWDGTREEGRLSNSRASNSAEIITIEGARYVALPTRGSGLWARPVPTDSVGVAIERLVPSDDAFARGGAFRDSVYGAAEVLELRQGDGGVNKSNIYLQFDLSEIELPTATATLRVYGSVSESASEALRMQLYSVATNEWDETTLTWSETPGTADRLAEIAITGTSDAWYEVDVTGFVNAQEEPVVSFMLRNPDGSPSLAVFSSKEGEQAPELLTGTLTSTPIDTSVDEVDKGDEAGSGHLPKPVV